MVKKPKTSQKLALPDKYDIKADAAIARAEAIVPTRPSKSSKAKPSRPRSADVSVGASQK